MEIKNEHGNAGNNNAGKPAADNKDGFIHARCKRSDKGLWVASAIKNKMNLTEWMVTTLNAAVKK